MANLGVATPGAPSGNVGKLYTAWCNAYTPGRGAGFPGARRLPRSGRRPNPEDQQFAGHEPNRIGRARGERPRHISCDSRAWSEGLRFVLDTAASGGTRGDKV